MNNLECKKAIILAAGRGSRMSELTDYQPKAFVRLGSKRLIDWQIESLRASGIEEIVVVGGYRCGDLSELGLPIIENVEWESTNMVFSLFCAKDEISQPVVVSYSDIVYSQKTVSRLGRCNDDIAIAFDRNWLEVWSKRFDDPLTDAESFKLGSDMNLTDIGKSVSSYDDIEGQYMGLLKFTPDGINKIAALTTERQRRTMDMTQLLSYLVNNNQPIHAIENHGFWFEIDSAHDLTVAEELLSEYQGNVS
jgi:choline kinase